MNEVLKAIKERRSIRTYSLEQLKEEDLKQIIEAGVFAPSACNTQPWHFTVVQNKELLDNMDLLCRKEMAKSDTDWIREWGENENFRVFYNAPTVIFVSGKKDSVSPLVDCSAAIENMILAGHSLGIGSCWIGLIRHFFVYTEELKKLNIPDGYEPYYAVTFGYKKTDKVISPLQRVKNTVSYIR